MSELREHQLRPGSEGFRAVGVSRAFDGVQALSDVSFELGRGEIVGLIGPNGAGKTTLVNIMSGFDAPDTGRIEMEGEDITSWKPTKRATAGLARTFQQGHLFAGMNVRENIAVAALGVGARGRAAGRRAAELLTLLDLEHRADSEARSLPHGEASKLGVARALATDPNYLLMDEPAAGLSEPEVPPFVEILNSLRSDHGIGVLLIDHNIELIVEVCDRIVVLDQGRVLVAGAAREVRDNPAVAAAYLGGSSVIGEAGDA
ncbi:MAG: ABC transporter ATP-binding protein [Actinobacteria bacterium]|nr:ABC transporter ATP-binding protein [Actinomycetota bacterium]